MHGPLTSEETARLRRLPAVRRAREHRLYTVDGARWVDAWADGGRALLGHRPGGVKLRIKNELDRGLCAPYPGVWERRLEKVLLRLFPGYERVCVFGSAERALAVLPVGQMPVDALDLPPAGALGSGEAVAAGAAEREGGRAAGGLEAGSEERYTGAVWGRPLLPGHPVADICFPVLPLSGLGEVQPVLFRAGLETDGPGAGRSGSGGNGAGCAGVGGLATGDAGAGGLGVAGAGDAAASGAGRAGELVSPLALAALTRSCMALLEAAGPAGAKRAEESRKQGKFRISLPCADIWKQRGPYLLFRGGKEEYADFFEMMMARKVLIAPGAGRPSVCPVSATEKELFLLCSREGSE